jgi:hypothetical protein
MPPARLLLTFGMFLRSPPFLQVKKEFFSLTAGLFPLIVKHDIAPKDLRLTCSLLGCVISYQDNTLYSQRRHRHIDSFILFAVTNFPQHFPPFNARIAFVI